MPLLETPGHSQASLGQSLLGSLLFSPGSWCTQVFVCALQESVSPVCVISGGCIVELMVTLSKSAPGLRHPEPLPLWHATADLHLHSRHSSTQSHVWLSLCCVSCCTQVLVWALRASLAGMGFDSKWDFAPLTIFWGLLFAFGLGYHFFCLWIGVSMWSPTFSCWWLFSSKLWFWSSYLMANEILLTWCQMKNNAFLKYDHEHYHYFMYLLISHLQ